ncbi:TonB-dependent receptor plug domain-containing protein [Sphingomonas sp. BK235]|uniref:TonB-dependent receptor n=1 Tax=Sphingomonas sp. BK235 TaxID=2512131 RepID=UPI0010EC72E7|nr:TonB-dependent receptor plug domain-containing protein [Sphingomonas sp. BK235]TCP29880.1 iron complex outermembrane receptor protein [Sphingomonas sp. BK235]
MFDPPRILRLQSLSLSAVALALAAGSAHAQAVPAAAATAASDPADAPQEGADVVVTGARDLNGVIQAGSTGSVFGIDKPLVDTPRSITAVSDELLSRYNIRNVFDLASVSAGASTGSYFGVPGSLNLRGNMADNYFNGFQGLSNFANYPTPVDATSSIEIVRGPASPVFGAGQVGGYLNFIPKTGYGEKTKYVNELSGNLTGVLGSYNQRELTGNVAIPLGIGGNAGGLHLFGKLEDSDSFYKGMHPESQIGQASYAGDLTSKLSVELTYQYIHSDGYLKNIGWNRVTQDLIDNGNYVAGRPIAQISDGVSPYITPQQFFQVTGGSTLMFYGPAIGVPVSPNDFTKLDPATIRTVKLSPRTTFIDEGVDVNEAYTNTGYGRLAYAFDNGSTLKFESFVNTLRSRNYQSYGFGSYYRSTVTEQRLSYLADFATGPVEWKTVFGGNYRFTDARVQSSLNDFVLSEDRRDLSVGATIDDRFNNPFAVDNFAWATDVQSTIRNIGGFALVDATLGPVSLTVGGRIDNYKVKSLNTGSEVDDARQTFRATDTTGSFNTSLAYKFQWATFYGTYAEARSVQVDQGGGINPALVQNDAYLGPSKLKEVGIKTSQFGGRLFAAIDAYEQQRSYLSTPPTGVQSVDARRTRGIEAELRYLVTRSLGVTGTFTHQRTKVLPTAGAGFFLTVPSCLAGIACTDGYGGYVFTNANRIPELQDGYYLHATPNTSASLFATYDRRGHWGLTGGVTYASQTGGYLPGAIKVPGYALFRAGAYVIDGPWRVDVNANNLFDKRYFIAGYDTDANANVLPGIGRTVQVRLSRNF